MNIVASFKPQYNHTKAEIFQILADRTEGPICYMSDTLEEHAERILEALDIVNSDKIDEQKDEIIELESDLASKIEIIDQFTDLLRKMHKRKEIESDTFDNLMEVLEG
jgi:hypothetical protein